MSPVPELNTGNIALAETTTGAYMVVKPKKALDKKGNKYVNKQS